VDSVRLTELRSGGVQLAENLPLQDVARLKGSPEVVLSIKEGFRYDYCYFVLDREPYGTNKKLRQAVSWALDREAIVETAYFGIGATGYQPFFPGTPYHDPAFRPYNRDLTRARQLLEEAGAPAPLRWEVALTADPVDQRVTQVIQSQLADIGI